MNPLHLPANTLPVLCQSVLQVGLGLLIQSTLLLLIGIAAGRFLRRRGPERQLHVYHATLAAVALCGFFSLIRSARFPSFYLLELPAAQSEEAHLPGIPAQTPSPATPQPGTDGTPVTRPQTTPPLRDARGHRVDVQPVEAPAPGVKRFAQPLKPFSDFLKPGHAPATRLIGRIYVALLCLWSGVALALILWLAICHAGVRRICRRARLVQEGEALALLARVCAEQGVKVPVLLASRDINSVFLAGGARPAILLPGGYAGEFDSATLQAVLAHEAAHLRTGDGRWTCCTRILCALLWMQPLLWYVCRLREQASEEVCDQAAVRLGVPAPAYARCLVTLAERLQPTRWEQVAGSGSVVFRSSLGQRVRRLMSEERRHWIPATWQFRTGISTACALLALVFSLAVSAAPPEMENGLQNDAALNRQVAITAEGVPIGDLLALMSKKTGIDLSAATEFQDYKIVILGPARPLRDVMYDMAALYNGVWHSIPTRSGQWRYLLVRDFRTSEYESRLAADVDNRILAKINEQIQALNDSPEELAKRSQNDPVRRALSDPDGRLATRVLATLSPRQLQQMVSLRWTSVPLAKLDEALKDDLEGLFNGPRVDEFNDMMMKQFHGAAIPNPSFSREQMDGQAVGFELHSILGQKGSATDISIDMSVPTGLSAHAGNVRADAQFLVPAHGNPYTGRKIAPDAPLPDPAQVAEAQGEAWVDRLQALVEKTGVPVISDYFRSRSVSVPATVDEVAPEPAVQALDAFCRPTGYLWWNRGKTLLFRKRDWYTQQLYEVPDRWVLAMGQHLREEKGGLTVGDCLSVLDLSTEQMAGLNEEAGWPSDRLEMAGCREMLQVIAAMHLDRGKRLYTGVIGGTVAPRDVALMPNLDDAEQRVAIMKFIEARERTRITPKDIKPGDWGFLVTPGGKLNDVATAIDAMIYSGHGTMTIGYRIALPTTLVDDRRDKTRVTVQG